MSESSAIETASKRLSLALEALEAAIDRRDVIGRDRETLAAQLQALGIDRSELACNLDAAVARSRSLEKTNREIARRLEVAIDTIRTVIEANDR
jgi:Domain of unknown function (DUF4164)